MKTLIKGYQQFLKKYFAQETELYQQLYQEQSPKFLFLACCDSRTDPAVIVNAQPGDIFVVRNIANYVPPLGNDKERNSETIAAIELAISLLSLEQIIILGHQRCAGIKLLVSGEIEKTIPNAPAVWHEQQEQIKNKISQLYDASNAELFEKANISIACHNLLTYPYIADKVEQKKLKVTGWYFHLNTGKIETYDPDTTAFTSLI